MVKTRERILDVAFDVLGRDLSVSLERIAEAAGVSRMTLHRHFGTRQALLEAMFIEYFAGQNRIVEGAIAQYDDPRDRLRAIVERSAVMGERFHFLFHVTEEFVDEETHRAMHETLNGKMTGIFEALRARGLIRKNVPNEWMLHLYDTILTCAWETTQHGCVAPRVIPELAWQSFAHGVFSHQAPNAPEQE